MFSLASYIVIGPLLVCLLIIIMIAIYCKRSGRLTFSRDDSGKLIYNLNLDKFGPTDSEMEGDDNDVYIDNNVYEGG